MSLNAPEMQEVLAANQAFYDAHEQRDLGAMDDVWVHGDEVACIHPGWPILRGWDDVRRSWEGIFNGPGRNQFVITNVAVTLTDALAIVTLDENLLDARAQGTVAATNVFRRDADGWRMTLHHGSPVMAR